MIYSVNQKVTYIAVGGKKEEATILARKVDSEDGKTIRTENASGNFDYLVLVEKNGKKEEHFCNESDIE